MRGCQPGLKRWAEAQVMRISITCIADRFAFDGDGAVTECVKLLCELFFQPPCGKRRVRRAGCRAGETAAA